MDALWKIGSSLFGELSTRAVQTKRKKNSGSISLFMKVAITGTHGRILTIFS
jgi:hypothetical protein